MHLDTSRSQCSSRSWVDAQAKNSSLARQYYLLAIKDREGRELDGSRAYHLAIPANVPIRQFWSATIYDRKTHAFIRNLPRPSRSSQEPGLQKNADGSVDIYFGPQAAAGEESNWVPTDPKSQFEVMLRFYGDCLDAAHAQETTRSAEMSCSLAA
jgi:hypothetical protein